MKNANRWRHGGTGQDTLLNAVLIGTAVLGLLLALASTPPPGRSDVAQPATSIAPALVVAESEAR